MIHVRSDLQIKADNLDFIVKRTELRIFQTTGFRLLSHDYSPVFELKKLEVLSINMPAYDHKEWNMLLAET